MKKISKILLGNKYKILFFLCFFIVFPIIYLKFFFILNLEKKPNSTIIFDTNGIEIGEIIKDKKFRYRYFSIKNTPIFLQKAVVKLEDKRFYTNSGVDILALFRAILHNLKAGKTVEGGSTISSQVIRNSLWLNEKRDLKHKLKEFSLAFILNLQFSKDEILEKYLNSISFGYLNFGFESASQFYFGKELKNLTKAEQIALIVIPKNAGKYDPYKKKKNFEKRYNFLLKFFKEKKLLSEKEYILAKNEKLNFLLKHKKRVNKLPYIKDFLNQKINFSNKKGKLKTTIDFDLTEKINSISQNIVANLEWKNVGDFGVLIVDKKTNEIKVLIGGNNYFGTDGQVNSVLAKRQPGSTIKPFNYLLSFKNFGFNGKTKIIDEPIQFFTEENYAYVPKNYSLKYKGEVSLEEALSQSLNIPAIKILNKVGVQNLLDFLRKIGITSLKEDADFYGLSLTLGSGEVSLFELLQAFTIFTNDGNFCEFKILKSEKGKCTKIIEKKYTNQIVEILSNGKIKLEEFPVNGNLDFGNKKVFVKTGTSRNFRDNWTIGFTENYLIGVWAGNKDGSPMKGVSGASGAGEIFKKIIENIEKDFEINEIFYTDFEEKNDKNVENKNYIQIISPLNGSIYQLNKNKNLENQKIKLDFFTNINFDEKKWLINGKEYKNNFWELQKGTVKIEIQIFKKGKFLEKEEIFIEVE